MAASTAAPSSSSPALDTPVDGFIFGIYRHNPKSAAYARKHEFDRKLPNYGMASLNATAH